MTTSRRECSRMLKYNLINGSPRFQLPDTAILMTVSGKFVGIRRKIVCNAWLQPPVAEKKPYFGGTLSVKTVY